MTDAVPIGCAAGRPSPTVWWAGSHDRREDAASNCPSLGESPHRGDDQ
ncbi:hypothetical protein [Haloarchaeobius sp. DFWS5]